MLRAAILLIISSAAFADGATLSPRNGWSFAEGAQDLIQAGSWDCVSAVTTSSGGIGIIATDIFNTVINTSGPRLKVQGNFSLLATLSAPVNTNTYLTLVGALNRGEWWNGLKRLDVGAAALGIVVNYWTGSSPDARSQTFRFSPANTNAYNLEVARIADQFVVFIDGAEVGRVADPGLFDSGQLYLGFNVAPQRTLSVLALAAAVPSDSVSNVSLFAPSLRVASRADSALRNRADARGFLVGAAVNPSLLSLDSYAETLGREFNLLVAENDMKFAATHPAPDRYNFCAADRLIAFAQANGMGVRGHTLVWHDSLPNWLTRGNYSCDDVLRILRDHIDTVVKHFKGNVLFWDVVNEAIAYGPPYGPQPSFWRQTIGPEYVDLAFRWAREADPDVKLFYNDTGGEGLGAKSDAVYNLVKGLLDRGVPLDGVGLQMHVGLTGAPTPATISANIQRLAQLGLSVHITEMDVRIPSPVTAANLAAQAAIYRGVVGACLANPKCEALLTWGVSDANSWIPGFFPGFGGALLFDEQFQPKPAYQAVLAALEQ
jgi:endo-1,4-beta-xylanase